MQKRHFLNSIALEIDFTENLIGREFLEFPHCGRGSTVTELRKCSFLHLGEINHIDFLNYFFEFTKKVGIASGKLTYQNTVWKLRTFTVTLFCQKFREINTFLLKRY